MGKTTLKILIITMFTSLLASCAGIRHASKGWNYYDDDKDYHSALKEFEISSTKGRGILSGVYRGLYRANRELGNIDTATYYLFTGIEQYPEDPWLIYDLALYYLDEKNQPCKAIPHLNKAINSSVGRTSKNDFFERILQYAKNECTEL